MSLRIIILKYVKNIIAKTVQELLKDYNRRSRKCTRPSRVKLKQLTGLLRGHCRFREQIGRLGIENDETCKFCQEEEEYGAVERCTVMDERARSLGDYQIDVQEITTLDPLHVLHF